MKYFIDSDANVYAYEADGSQDEHIKPGLIPYNRATSEDGSFYPAYLSNPDSEGIYQPDLQACLEIDKENQRKRVIVDLKESDTESIRTIDDLVEYIVNETPLPQAVLDRVDARKQLRFKLKEVT